MDELQLVERATLTRDQLTEVCRSGLVVELLLMPYGGLKEYALYERQSQILSYCRGQSRLEATHSRVDVGGGYAA
jgi:hypothetical protein